MPLTVNPLLPAHYDLMWAVGMVAVVVLGVSAFISISRRARQTPLPVSLAWIAGVLLIPVLGPLAWFLIGRRRAAPSLDR
ncbi:PLDc N-terminal domain-containing protein [Agrococcus terreus]|uniref:PLDc N-terminal domain-containing protein n=1 Tax=Agrococcus terreus TaxID=574649 RepID=UPI00384C0E1B